MLIHLLLICPAAAAEICRSADSGPVSCNDTITGTISPAGDTDPYTFSASASGVVSIRIVPGSINQMCYRLFGPGGGQIGSQQCGVAEFSIASGLHALQVEAASASATGSYSLTLQAVSASLTCGPGIVCDETRNDSIDCLGDTDALTIMADPGDIISFRIAPSTTMCFRLFSPAGSPIGAQQCNAAEFTFSTTGRHTILVAPNAASTTGAYGLTRQDIIGSSACGVGIACGQTVSGQIDSLGDVDAYLFNASSAGGIAIRMAAATLTNPMCFKLFSPIGTPIGTRVCDFKDYLLSSGIHTMLVEPSTSSNTGGYAFTLEGVSPALGCGQAITCGQVIQGQIDQLGDEDAYTFSATAGDGVSIKINGGAITPMCYRLYGPGGVAIGARQCNTTVGYVIAATGAHTILTEPLSAGVGSYTLELQCTTCSDIDRDTRCDTADNCPATYNPSQTDTDGDAHGDACDCAPANGGAFALPGEVANLDIAADGITITWSSAAPASGSSTVHDLLRGSATELPVGGKPSEICLAPGLAGSVATDLAAPPGGKAFWYLVRGRNVCGAGTYGATSAGAQRTSPACP